MAQRRGGSMVDPDRYERWTEWGPLHPGLDVKIKGESGWFHFLACVRNPRTEEVWIDVYGGARGREKNRSFAPDRIRLRPNGQPMARRHRRAVVEEGDTSDDAALGITPKAKRRGGRRAGKGGWHVATLDGGVVFTADSRKAARDWVNNQVATRLRRNVLRPNFVELTTGDGEDTVRTWYIGTTEEMRVEGFTVAMDEPDPAVDDGNEEDDEEYDDDTDDEGQDGNDDDDI